MTSALEQQPSSPAGDPSRFGGRWRLVSAGLSNVWRYGDLVLNANSGRMLLRGPNGTGKTTALEVLWPFLLDLDKAKLRAGTSRTTTLTSLMRESHDERKRVGYAWMTLAGPGDEGRHTYGARLMFVNGATPTVKVEPFTIPGEPLTDMPLRDGSSAITSGDAFRDLVESIGGTVFRDDDEYVTALGNHVFGAARTDLIALADRIRTVRNPSNLAVTSAEQAAQALRLALPGVDSDVIHATGDALAATEETRAAFQRDQEASTVISAFAQAWRGHAADVASRTATTAHEAQTELDAAEKKARECAAAHQEAIRVRQRRDEDLLAAKRDLEAVRADIAAIEKSPAYANIGRLADLHDKATAQAREAAAKIDALETRVYTLRRANSRLLRRANDLADDIKQTVADALQSGSETGRTLPAIVVSALPAAVLAVAERSFDPGPTISIHGDPDNLEATTQAWAALAERRQLLADQARLMLAEHRNTVAPAAEKASRAVIQADREDEEAEAAAQKRDRLTAEADAAAKQLGATVASWATSNPDLATAPHADQLDTDAINDFLAEGAAALLGAADVWDRTATRVAETIFAENTAAAADRLEHASALRAEANETRRRAEELRTGRDIPPPRPHWASLADDQVFANSLQWNPAAANANKETRALIESALAASGILGATLTNDGLQHIDWALNAATAVVSPNLTAFVEPDPAHPDAKLAESVLNRIGLHVEGSAPDPALNEAAAVISTNGDFRLGVITGRAPGTVDRAALPPASHIGAAQRRAAALAEAARLETSADELERRAAEFEAARLALLNTAKNARRRAASFPARNDLDAAERSRATAASIARDKRVAAEESKLKASRAQRDLTEIFDQWRISLVALSLPGDLDELTIARETAQHTAHALRGHAKTLTRHRGTLTELRDEIDEHASERAALPAILAGAAAADAEARRTMLEYDRLHAEFGKDAAELARRLEDNKAVEQEAYELVEMSLEYQREALTEESKAQEQSSHASQSAADKQTPTDAALADLRGLLAVPDVAEAVLPLGVEKAIGTELIEQVLGAVDALTTTGRRKLYETYETARAELAGVWAIDRTDGYGDTLDTYQCSYDGGVMSPLTAAARALDLAARASEQLQEAEDSALHDFIVGRLPAAIGAAWVEQGDWVKAVNKKMKSASASSGVGVQVSTSLRQDLAPNQRIVYQLACQKSAATRTLDEEARLAVALKSLLEVADGETVTDRVRQAVDVRDWIRVDYHVHRPGQDPKRWTRNTGLSGGERRLVILAPMLASVAALHDNFASTALRLAALDEVPAEVDEQGREGLARYLAELDLDVICTSYLWDGAPGAWDGIDAYDLEACDGIVVGFPMLVRGLDPLPGDPEMNP